LVAAGLKPFVYRRGVLVAAGLKPFVYRRGVLVAAGLQPRVGRSQNLSNRQEVERAVIEREGRTLATALERVSGAQLLVPLDVARRERAKRASDLTAREVGEIPRFGSFEPAAERVV
jgi:hypothetical protein